MIMLEKSKFNSTKEAIDINDVNINNILVSSKYHILLIDSADQTDLKIKIDTIFWQHTFLFQYNVSLPSGSICKSSKHDIAKYFIKIFNG